MARSSLSSRKSSRLCSCRRRESSALPARPTQPARTRSGSSPEPGGKVVCAIEQLGDASLALGGRVRGPEVLERDRELEPETGLLRGRPIEGSTKVLQLGEAGRQVERLVVVLGEVRFGRNLEHPLGVSARELRGLA